MIGYIYKIELEGKLLYIGKTTQQLCKRKTNHKESCFYHKSKHHIKLYKTLREEYNITAKNFSKLINLECIEEVIYEDKFQLQLRERHYIIKLKPSCNQSIPVSFNCVGLSKKEFNKIYREKNKDKISKQTKIYRTKNKDKISKRNKFKIICSCGSISSNSHIQRHKQSNKHKELLNKRLGAKYLLHKELLNI